MQSAGGRHAVVGPSIVADDELLDHHALIIDSGLIHAITPRAALPESLPTVDVGPGILTAGLIDIHTHGAAGRSFNEGTGDAFAAVGATLLAAGVTTILPTLASAPIAQLVSALENVPATAHGPATSGVLPRMPGMHLEGPFFSPAQAGAQDVRALRVPSDGTADRLLDHSSAISMLSLAPELPGAPELTARLVEAGVVVAAGHSAGTASDLAACESVGLSHVTHVFSGQSTTVRDGPWRVPGLLEASLASETLTVEMIGDGKHLPGLLMQLAHKCAGERLCLVSDSTAGAGLPDGASYQMGDVTYVVDDGVGMTADRTSFGGSTTLIPQMIPVVLDALGIPLPQVIAMVTSAPARAARLERLGRLAPGFLADLTLFDESLTPRAVAFEGSWQQISRPTATQPKGHPQ